MLGSVKINSVLSIGETVVEFFSKEKNQQFTEIGKDYMGPSPSGVPTILID